MEKFIDKFSWDDKAIEIYRDEESCLWTACIRKEDEPYVLVRDHKSKEEIIYDLKFCGLAKRKPRKKLSNVAVGNYIYGFSGSSTADYGLSQQRLTRQ